MMKLYTADLLSGAFAALWQIKQVAFLNGAQFQIIPRNIVPKRFGFFENLS